MLGLIILIVSISVIMALGILVIVHDSKSRINQLYFWLTLALTVLVIANYLSFDQRLDQLLLVRSVMAASTAAISLILALILFLRSANTSYRLSRAWLAVLLGSTVGVMILDFTPLIFQAVTVGSPPQPIPGPMVVLYVAHFAIVAVAAVTALVRALQTSHNRKRRQFVAIFVGMLPILLFALVTSFVLPLLLKNTNLIMFTPLYAVFFVIAIGYAIIRYGLFDIRSAAVRSLAYILTLLVVSAIYFLLVYTISLVIIKEGSVAAGINPINIAAALLLIFAFQPIKNFFDGATNRLFYRKSYDPAEFIDEVSRFLATTSELEKLQKGIITRIVATLNAAGGYFTVYLPDDRQVTHRSGKEVKIINNKTSARILDVATSDEDVVILTSNLAKFTQRHAILARHGIELLVTLRNNNGEILGHLALSERLGRGYGQQDIRVLRTISDGLAIAIQNALSVHEVKKLNATLQQRVDDATSELRQSNAKLQKLDEAKDEFISMASHQLRTPLTSVKGYIDMVLEGDAGTVNPQQQKLLGEAFESSERMVHLINDFLNVSRLQTGKFMLEIHPTDLTHVVAQEVEALKTTATARSLKLTYRAPKNFPLLDIDEGKIRQVIMNMIDNAIYYSRPSSTIRVVLKKDDGDIVFEVHDTGIGVPASEQKQLFAKFFRATNARKQRPDGTGVGLFLAKKVVTAHRGGVIFRSEEGKGSVFGFRLPLAQLLHTDNADNTGNQQD